jgi:ABC-type nitrate/sulfonate/bicarbonate transport system substrate-binding protein
MRQLNRRHFIGAVALSAAGVGAAAGILSRRSQPLKKLIVADSHAVSSALFYVARDLGYLTQEQLAVKTIDAASGKEALELVIKGKADLCMVAEAPFVRAIAAGSSVRIAATIETSERNTGIVVPDGSAIKVPLDLRGTRIGFCPGTASEYFLSVFLQANAISDEDVIRVQLAPKDAHHALASGDVDALAAWQEIRARADKELGHRTRIFYAAGVYMETWNLTGKSELFEAEDAAMQRLLNALLKAQKFTAENPSRAIDITAKAIEVDRGTIHEMWPNYAFDVGLDQALVANLEGHWRMINREGENQSPPDFLVDLSPEALNAISPDRVTYYR